MRGRCHGDVTPSLLPSAILTRHDEVVTSTGDTANEVAHSALNQPAALRVEDAISPSTSSRYAICDLDHDTSPPSLPQAFLPPRIQPSSPPAASSRPAVAPISGILGRHAAHRLRIELSARSRAPAFFAASSLASQGVRHGSRRPRSASQAPPQAGRRRPVVRRLALVSTGFDALSAGFLRLRARSCSPLRRCFGYAEVRSRRRLPHKSQIARRRASTRRFTEASQKSTGRGDGLTRPIQDDFREAG